MFTIDRYAITILGLPIRFYALILITAALVGAWMVARRARTRGLDPLHVWDGLFWALIPALIGARLYHVLTPSPSLGTNYYLENPIRIFEIWNGGLGIYGALLGGVIGAWFYLRRHDQSLLVWLDIIAPAVAIGQGIGRWANFVNQELYGAPTTLPWALYIEPAKRLPGYTQFETFHPLFLYESLWNFAAGVILLIVAHRLHGWLKRGDLVLLYLMEYATIRFLLDFVRLDSNMSGLVTLTTAQVVSLMTFVVAIAVLIWRHRPQRQAVA